VEAQATIRLSFIKLFDWVFHCDLSIESMLYTKKKADKQNINNIIFVRTDYTRPPFNASLDLIFCGDSLIYSPFHEGLVMKKGIANCFCVERSVKKL